MLDILQYTNDDDLQNEGGKVRKGERREEEEEWARGCWEREHFAPTGSGGAGTF